MAAALSHFTVASGCLIRGLSTYTWQQMAVIDRLHDGPAQRQVLGSRLWPSGQHGHGRGVCTIGRSCCGELKWIKTAMLSFSSPGSPKTSTGRLVADAMMVLSTEGEGGGLLEGWVRWERVARRTVLDRAQRQQPVLATALHTGSCL